MHATNADRGLILLIGRDGRFEPAAAIPEDQPLSRRIQEAAEEACRAGITTFVSVSSAEGEPELDSPASSESACESACVPLEVTPWLSGSAVVPPWIESAKRTVAIGAICLEGIALSVRSGDDDEQLRSLASMAAVAIESTRLCTDLLERNSFEQELALARRVQERMLKTDLPRLPWLDVDVLSVPFHGVAGDYFDFLEAANGRILFSVGDVSGKGIPAALLMASLQSSFRAAAATETDLRAICRTINGFLHRHTPMEQYATLFIGCLEAPGPNAPNRLRFVNAGHLPPFLLRGGECVELFGGGLAVGMFPHQEYELHEMELSADSTILCYTDGITESEDGRGRHFGRESVLRILHENRTGSPRDINQAIHNAVIQHVADGPGSRDDATLVAMRTG
jgi:serine phosphatase RsbU (regulator of sigma subunit)